MKKIITLLAVALFATTVSAQAPQKMSYQAVIRNASNVLVANANIRMRISVLQGTATGTSVYIETQTATTNVNGLATLEIGNGTVVSGTFASIAWGTNAYFIKTETDPTGGTNYTIVGTSQFLSVPYALFASNSGSSTNNWTATGSNIANNNIGNVGIGTGATIPSSKLTVKQDNIGFTQEDTSGASKIGFYTNAAGAWLQTHSNTDLSFATNDGATQMTLQKATGNLGIGVTAPIEKLEVAGKTKTTNLQVTNGAGVGKVLTSDVSGNASWQSSSAGSVTFTHYIGEVFGGGIVVSVWKVGSIEHGLIVSPSNLHNPANGGNGIAWSNNDTTLIGATAASITNGQTNTDAIINQPGHTVSAASVCRAYNGGGFNDWYLPSITELNECRKNLFIINTVATEAFYSLTYWSSTESFNGSYAMSQNFNLSDSIDQASFKNFTYGIRAMRKF